MMSYSLTIGFFGLKSNYNVPK